MIESIRIWAARYSRLHRYANVDVCVVQWIKCQMHFNRKCRRQKEEEEKNGRERNVQVKLWLQANRRRMRMHTHTHSEIPGYRLTEIDPKRLCEEIERETEDKKKTYRMQLLRLFFLFFGAECLLEPLPSFYCLLPFGVGDARSMLNIFMRCICMSGVLLFTSYAARFKRAYVPSRSPSSSFVRFGRFQSAVNKWTRKKKINKK